MNHEILPAVLTREMESIRYASYLRLISMISISCCDLKICDKDFDLRIPMTSWNASWKGTTILTQKRFLTNRKQDESIKLIITELIIIIIYLLAIWIIC